VLVEALLALGDADEALRTLGRALSGLGTAGFPQRAKGVLCSLGEALLRAGLTDEALAVFRRLAVPWSCSVPSLPAEPETVSRHHAT
jgi:tetratricopeptide (TPR) repeat protein